MPTAVVFRVALAVGIPLIGGVYLGHPHAAVAGGERDAEHHSRGSSRGTNLEEVSTPRCHHSHLTGFLSCLCAKPAFRAGPVNSHLSPLLALPAKIFSPYVIGLLVLSARTHQGRVLPSALA